ncbi:SDR family NAD(P)-dependent oxidoreductase [Glycomyces tenuis]|uniref:SDR family NAD(P)-dependent oxidoreductase n=1 Tax=Glycomyces tenuis TaxID=58116 RepID=UPI00040B13F8|nr:SDR family oxidoreductase [Glycomyces tenuis]
MPQRFESKVVIVTGGATGMGLAVAERVAAEGGTVLIASRRKDVGETAVASITAKGGTAAYVRTDVTVEAEVERLVAVAIGEYGGLHGAFNNAGGMNAFGPLPQVETEAWHADIAQSLTSVFFGLKHQIPAIAASGGGAIVNNASNLGVVGLGTVAPYVAAKHGVVGLTKAAALETAAQGVRVNAVLPGGVDTPLFGATTGATAEGREMVEGLHPLGRVARPEEIAASVCHLLSDEASFITGTAMSIDGGFTAR